MFIDNSNIYSNRKTIYCYERSPKRILLIRQKEKKNLKVDSGRQEKELRDLSDDNLYDE